jgi:hypothetical protein
MLCLLISLQDISTATLLIGERAAAAVLVVDELEREKSE